MKHRELITLVLTDTVTNDSGELITTDYLYLIMKCCLLKLVDERLFATANSTSTNDLILHEYNVSIIRAFNLILLKLSSTAASLSTEMNSNSSCELIICLLRILYNTNSANTHASDITPSTDLLPFAVTKPTSR